MTKIRATDRLFVIPGVFLFLTMIASYGAWNVLPGPTVKHCTLVGSACFSGFCAGLALLGVGVLLRQSYTEGRSSKLLRQMGLAGVWQGEESAVVPFAKELMTGIQNESRLDAIGIDGRMLLRLFSDPSQPEFTAPHPALIGAQIRLLLLPPRSYRIDPERSRMTCAEEALSRLNRSPEEHWRHLHDSLQIRDRWTKEYGVTIQIKFLEERPVFSTLMVGSRVWFRPWDATRALWIEGQDEKLAHRLVSALRDQFVSFWSTASQDLKFPQAPDLTGSVFIRRGIETTSAEVEEASLA